MAAKTTVRIPVSKKPGEALALATLVFAKHQADGASSPLKAITEWQTVGPTIAAAADTQTRIEAMEKQLEKLYETRDNLLPAILDVTQRSRTLLGSIYKKAPRTLGDWGYTVDDTPRAPAAAKPKKPPGGTA